MFNLFDLIDPVRGLEDEEFAEKEPLSDSSRQLLSQQVFTANHPNAIVQDFGAFIEFLQIHKVEVSANQNAIAPKYLPDLNQRLSHPITIDLLRSSQKSYAYIHGLYFLARSSAIAQVHSDKKKKWLQVEPQALKSWQELNDTEKYFNLLATLIYHVDEGTMSNHSGSFTDWWFIFHGWKRLPAKGLKFTNSKNESWLISVRLHNVALLHLFGFIEVKDTAPLAGKGWRITQVLPLPFGIAMMELFEKTNWLRGLYVDSDSEDFDFPEVTTSKEMDVVVQKLTPTEILQEEFHAVELFEAWERNLQLPEIESQDGIFVFAVSLKSAWRKIAISSASSLLSFSSAILKAFDFDNDHLHQFTYKDRQGFPRSISHPYSQEEPSTDKVLIRDVPIKVGDRLTYVFDFGDWWEFQILLESIGESDPKFKNPKVIDQKGKAPEQYRD